MKRLTDEEKDEREVAACPHASFLPHLTRGVIHRHVEPTPRSQWLACWRKVYRGAPERT